MKPFSTENTIDWKTLKEDYTRNGFATIQGVFPEDFLEPARRHVFSILKNHPEMSPERVNPFLLLEDPIWFSWVLDKRLLRIAEQFLGPDLVLYISNIFCKPPHSSLPIPWHQDTPYWPLEPMEVLSIWVALSDSTPENGGVRVIPGSHLGPVHEHVELKDEESAFGSGIPPHQVEETKAQDLVLAAGDVSLHHPNLIHGSPPNRSATWRMGFAVRYIPTTTRITNPRLATPFLLQGRAVPGVNRYLPHPQ